MNGVHDIGGMHGFGKVEPEPEGEAFHHAWEGRAFALTRAMAYCGLWNIDIIRWYREVLPPAVYMAASYFEKWTLGLEDQCVAYGLVGHDELQAGHMLHPPKPVKRRLAPEGVKASLARNSFERPSPSAPKFKAGDRVRMKNINPASHTRLPRYVRGHVGVVEAVRFCHVFPDAITTGNGEDPQWLYAVVFDGRELWGDDGDPTLTVSVEAFEPYLALV